MKLDQLIENALVDTSKEAELFAFLLETTLYVHAPMKPKSAKLSVVQFTTPQGVLAIPVFTDEQKAEFAGRGNVRTVAIQGRRLFAATLGANVVINPNDAWCILYPEEIRALLEGKILGRKPENVEINNEVKLRPANSPSAAFIDLLANSLASTEHALDGWLTEADDDERVSAIKYVVVIAAALPHHERIARSLTLALSDFGESLGRVVVITFIEPGATHDAWLTGNSSCLIYRRSWLPSVRSGIYGNA
jgi:hypothetical protein